MKINREQVYLKCGGKCAYCGEVITIKQMHVDHIVPKSFYLEHIKNKNRIPKFLNHLTEGDTNHIDNLLPTCRICNKWKSANDLELFRKEISEQVKRLNNYSSNFRLAKKYGLVQETVKPTVFYFETLN